MNKFLTIAFVVFSIITFSVAGQEGIPAGDVVFATGNSFIISRGGENLSYDVLYDDVLGISVLTDDYVHTDEGTFLEIKLTESENVLKISENTSFRITSTNYRGSADVSLTYGRVRAKVGRLVGNDAFSIRGPSLVAGVRGTDFGYDVVVDYVGGEQAPVNKVYCFSGKVEVATYETIEKKEIESIVITSDEMVTFSAKRPSAPLIVEPVLPEIRNFWVENNFQTIEADLKPVSKLKTEPEPKQELEPSPSDEEELKTETLEQAAANDKYSVRDLEGFETLNKKIENYYFGKSARTEQDMVREKVKTLLTRYETKTITKIDSLTANIQNESEIELYKQWGDLIMSNLHRIAKGDTWLETENYFGDRDTVVIQLDPEISPIENAEQYYEKYKSGKSGRVTILNELHNEREKLQNILQDKEKLHDDPDDPVLCKNLLKKYAKSRSHYSSEEDERFPGISYKSGVFTLYVGRTAKENDQLLRHYVKGNDYWLHARDYPGAYVFIKHIPGKTVPLETLIDAGNLALHFSKAKNTGTADLYYTQVKYLRRAKHGKTGLVIPTQEKNLTITLDNQRIKKLKEQNTKTYLNYS